MQNPQDKFNGRAAAYAKGRPAYPTALIQWLNDRFQLAPGKLVADMGSGTGIFTQALLETGATVYAVEPNTEMRQIAEQRLGQSPNFISVPRPAEATSLPEHRFDLITAAQAFHWFDPERFNSEAQRLLKPDGALVLIWNLKDQADPLVLAYKEILRQYCPAFKGFAGGIFDHLGELRGFFAQPPQELSFENPIAFSREKFLDSVASSSYALSSSDPQYAAFQTALNQLFDAYAVDDCLTIPNNCVAFVGRPRNPYAKLPIQVLPADPAWPAEFEKIEAYLTPVFSAGVLRIEHVGSTSVPGLAAKPVIDLDLVIPDRSSFPKLQACLEALGYAYDGDKGIPGREAFSYKSLPGLMKHHLYVCTADSAELKRHLKFRDHLRAHEADRAEYAAEKLRAAAKHPHDIDAYLDEKGEFILRVYRKLGLEP